MQNFRKEDLIYPELSYKIVGILFESYNQLGGGHRENAYQKAVAANLKKSGINFKEQVFSPLIINNDKICKYFLDFLVEEKIILEIKKGSYFRSENISQVVGYLKTTNLKLGIIANFTATNVKYRRILNLY